MHVLTVVNLLGLVEVCIKGCVGTPLICVIMLLQ